MRTILLDTFCGAGGCTKGYQRSGFSVVGVDVNPQPRYCGNAFVLMDSIEALDVLIAGGVIVDKSGRKWSLSDFDAIHASPPCQAFSEATPPQYRGNHPNLIPALRDRLSSLGKPSIIENVEGARKHLVLPIMLCGTMFGLPLWRHRFFEIARVQPFSVPFACNHERRPVVLHPGSNTRRLGPVVVSGTTRRKSGRFEFNVADCRAAMGIDWMTRKEIDQAIPPAYTEFIGRQLMRAITPQPTALQADAQRGER